MGEKIRFRASGVGALMVGSHGLTDKQQEMLDSLQSRHDQSITGDAKPLTDKMKETMDDLISKRDAPFELSQTAKSFVHSEWMRVTYGYDPVVVTKEILKGQLCEQDAFDLVSRVCPCDEFRAKNRQRFNNDFYTGEPDLILSDCVEDVKNCWDLKTFFEKDSVDPIYYAQGQVYMDLTGVKDFRLHYCLVSTPVELLSEMEQRLFNRFGRDDKNQDYIESVEALYRNHSYDQIDEKIRVKTFRFGYDEHYIHELNKRVGYAREYFKTIKL